MPFADSGGLRIHYQSFGAGRPIVLVHGWGSDLEQNWLQPGWIEALSAIRRVVALDVRGHGRSDKPHLRVAYGYRAMSRDVLAVMDALGTPRADLLGYSMGSFMGVCLLGDAAQRFGAMVLGGIGDETPESAAAGEGIAAALRARRESPPAGSFARAVRAYVESNPRNDDLEALALSALEMWPDGADVIALGGPRLAPNRTPVLVVNGAADLPYVLSDERLVAAIPGARLERIPGCDHRSAVTDPRFQATAVAFLSEL